MNLFVNSYIENIRTKNVHFYDAYDYSDIYLVPNKCVVESRKNCDTSFIMDNGHIKMKFDMPVVASNMKSVVDQQTCEFFAQHNWFYIMHRFGINQIEFIESMHKKGYFASISIGINDSSKREVEEIYNAGYIPEFITIDIANCWYYRAKEMVDFVRKYFPKSYLIIGNVATSEAVKEVQEWEVDAIKVGIGSGKVCTTKNKTGFHIPMVTTILDCAKVAKKPLIADGGVREHGDIAKAISLGAYIVMAGSLFAGYDESAGTLVEINGRKYKEYFGSASEYNKGQYKNVEGTKMLVPHKGSMKKLLIELKEDLQSSISYCGGKTLQDLRNYNKFVVL